MADLQEQLQAILGDPQAMGQITAIARALTGGGPPPPPEPATPIQDVDFVPVEDAPAQDPFSDSGEVTSNQGFEAPDLSALTGLVGEGMDIDPRLIQLMLRFYGEYSAQDNEKAALLAALKPFLREERLEKMEKAERVARLSRLVRLAIQLLKEEGGERV